MIILLVKALYQCPIKSRDVLIDFNDCSSSWNRLMFYVSALQSYVVYSTAMTRVNYVCLSLYTSERLCAARLSMPGLSAEAHYQDAVVSQ